MFLYNQFQVSAENLVLKSRAFLSYNLIIFICFFQISTHLYPISFIFSDVWSTGLNILCSSKESNSSYIVSFHCGQSCLHRHSLMVCGLWCSLLLVISSVTVKANMSSTIILFLSHISSWYIIYWYFLTFLFFIHHFLCMILLYVLFWSTHLYYLLLFWRLFRSFLI